MRVRLLVGIAVVFCAAGLAVAAPRGAGHADKAVRGWLRQSQGKPLAASLGENTRRVETFKDDNGEPLYYIVYLEPQGYVIVPADDEVEPIIGFAPEGVYDPSPLTPMGALVSADMAGRVTAARSEKHSLANPGHQRFFKARTRWQLLESVGDATVSPPTTHVSSVSDVRVAPMTQSKWSQDTECSNDCYNIYTPGNYVCGCVATAMAQLMRFYQYPARPATTGPFSITVDGSTQTRSLRGGDGSGGNYAWSSMVLDPDCSTTLEQRQAIGALTHDAGVAVHMQYTSGSSGAWMNDARDAMVSVFSYSNVIHGGPYHSNGNIGSSLNTMINPNLDAGLPCLLAIYGDGGHAIVCDGYGYNSSTLYHHLNMGWAGSSDAWYNLPGIDAGGYAFDVVSICLYNIYVTGWGEVISGRVLDRNGNPLSDATVTAAISGGNTYTATSNSKGIYAFARIPSSTTYMMQASKPGYNFFPTSVATGSSTNYQNTSGNKWAVDFVQPANGAAELTSVTVTPPGGSTCNEYYFSVHYYDAEGDAPVSSQGTLTLRGASTASITMNLESGTPVNGTYGGSARLDSGAYGFQISFNDTAGMTAITPWQGGPYVSLCSDMNGDGLVNMIEFADLAARWMAQGCNEGNSWCSHADIDRSGQVGSDDLAFVAFDWMTPPVAGGPDFALVPAGTFRMGDVADGVNASELPVHNVTLNSFIIGRYEVTNAQYCAALNWANTAGLVTVVSGVVKGVSNNQSYCNTTTVLPAYSRIVWNGTVFSVVAGKEDHPMVMVTWMGAAAYCNWRSEMELKQPCYDTSTWACNFANNGYRLPTEAEWEYAARGGLDGLRYPWGSTIVGAQANYSGSGDPYQVSPYPYTTPVGFYDGSLRYKTDFNWPGAATSYQTTSGMNGYQMFDIAGNVNELCNDWFSSTYYSTRPDPDVNPTGPLTATAGRVIRSGSWNSSTNYCRLSQRDGASTTMAAHTIGFRIVRNAD
jgi:formylglycine-generating enzyme required for sulfatase activity